MFLSKLARRFFPLSLFAYLIGLTIAPSAQSISFTGNLSWTGLNGTTSLTGSFTGDSGSDEFITTIVTASGVASNELTFFEVTFTDSDNPESAKTYTLSQLINFSNYNDSTGFVFNYDIANGTVSQTGASTNITSGLSIGSPIAIGQPGAGYLLESSASASPNNLTLTDNINFNGTAGGIVTATPVPFEFEGSAGILTLGVIWGVNQWRKNRIKK